MRDTACQIPEEVIPNRGARMSISSHPRKEGSDSVGIQAGFSTRKSERSPPPPNPPCTLHSHLAGSTCAVVAPSNALWDWVKGKVIAD